MFKNCEGLYPYSVYDIRADDIDKMAEPKQAKNIIIANNKENGRKSISHNNDECNSLEDLAEFSKQYGQALYT